MKSRLIGVIVVVGLVAAVAGLLRQTQASANGRTAWGDPDLQGIWTDPYQTPLQRPSQFASKEFFTDEERTKLDEQRAGIPRRDQRVERGSERDVAGAYNAVFQSVRPTGKRTSLIVDPPDGRVPALTPEATKRNDAEREYRLALLQATETCKNKDAACAGGKYGPPSPKRAEMPPFYNTGRTNRNDGPEDRSMTERCMGAVLPDFGGYRRIVQTRGSVSIFYDTGQGQGWQRVIPIDAGAHLPPSIRQRFGDSRGRWEGNTLVVDVTNFSPKFGFQTARDGLHLLERFTRVDANTIEYSVTIEDATTWTKPWTVKQEFVRQNDQANRIYYEPRCHEGNYGLPTMLLGTRVEERAFTRGEGPDPATKDTATDFGNEGGIDALTGAAGAIFERLKELNVANRFNGFTIVTAIVCLAVGAAIALLLPRPSAEGASRPARTADGRPNLSGVWQANNEASWDLEAHEARAGMVTQPGVYPYAFARVPAAPVLALGAAAGVPGSLGVVQGDGQIPYKPEAAAIKKENGENWIDRDPELKCYLPGIPRAMYMPYPFQIVQGTDKIQMAYTFSNAARSIHLDKVEGPPDDTYMGHSVGRWEGDTLVVDVTGFNGRNWFDRAGNFHSPSLHLVERFTPLGADAIQYEVTIEDPEVFTRTWQIAMPLYRRLEANMQLIEYPCIEFSEEFMYGHVRKQPLVKRWEGETMIIDITRKVPSGDRFYEWYRR